MQLLTAAITMSLYVSNRISAKTSFYTKVAYCINFAGFVYKDADWYHGA